jgi:predicted transcriptional regulator
VAERAQRLGVRLSPMLVARLDELAAARKVSRSECLRQLIAEAALRPGEEIPDEAELLSIVAERARAGNVAACRMLLDRRAGEPVSEFERLLNVRLAGGDLG